MKKKINPQHYLTDSLITSDEWDNFDYNLQSEIKELAEIGYDNRPENWKENTLAYGYLSYSEKLLRERVQWRGIENIRELRTLIKTYDHLKTFLLTLRVATIVYRTGLIPKFVTEGEAHFKYRNEQSEKGGKPRSHGGKTPAEIQARNNQIIEHFKKALLKNPTLTSSSFAENNAAKYSLKPRWVRDILKMAVGS